MQRTRENAASAWREISLLFTWRMAIVKPPVSAEETCEGRACIQDLMPFAPARMTMTTDDHFQRYAKGCKRYNYDFITYIY